MVQVGYKYYSQCYDLKKKKLEGSNPRYKDIDRFGTRAKDIPNNIDTSLINAKNAEIYLNNGSEASRQRRGGSKRRKASKNATRSNLNQSRADEMENQLNSREGSVGATYGHDQQVDNTE